jgi:hypothetical protein
MNALIVFVILLVALFAVVYIPKRRFGVLGLALCAGSLLSASWTSTLTPWVASQGVSVVAPPLSSIVAALLILLPPALLVFSGPTYSSSLQRLVGSIAFAALALVFLLQPLGSALVLDSFGAQAYNVLRGSSNVITVAGIALALVDIWMTRTPHHGKKSSH